jgi:hypothetical protein
LLRIREARKKTRIREKARKSPRLAITSSAAHEDDADKDSDDEDSDDEDNDVAP